MTDSLSWSCKYFEELSLQELYEILFLRQEVFVVEQDCPYIDADGLDLQSYHLSARNSEGTLVAYSRILPPGLSFNELSIGRIITSKLVRRTGIGHVLMNRSIDTAYDLYGRQDIRIGGQTYLLKFYKEFGFKPDGEEYLEDGIPHFEMVLQSS